MADTLWSHPERLRELLSRAASAASGSGRTVMESAGLSWQSLSAWKSGSRTPRPDNLRALGQALLLRADRLSVLARELIEAADAEDASRNSRNSVQLSEESLSLFGPDHAYRGSA
jgi:hypothetical protein